ncbi:hypothetical protein [Nostoc sp. KVJ3]|uniref:hypothetical protein n=1 Tax=Nostoc sp. KVJ3 TaxID=457945 RepID=UPI0022384D8D|nr:hypothetical protein [Nostoc sp. KVJ3]
MSLVLGIDELPTLYLPALVDWLNQNREDGLVSILGLQNLSMLIESMVKTQLMQYLVVVRPKHSLIPKMM